LRVAPVHEGDEAGAYTALERRYSTMTAAAAAGAAHNSGNVLLAVQMMPLLWGQVGLLS
jgi:hypothetical protein